MVRGIGRAHKISKKNSQQPENTNGPLNTTLPNFHSYDKFNEKIDVVSKKILNAETYSSPSNNVIDTTDDLI